MSGFDTKNSVNYESYNKAILCDILRCYVISFLSFDWMIKKCTFQMQLKVRRQIARWFYFSAQQIQTLPPELSTSSSNMAFLLPFLFALLATCIVDFDGQHSTRLRENRQGNFTALILRVFKSLSCLEYGDIFRIFYGGGGSGGDDDNSPPFCTPSRWNLLPFMDSNSLLFYDLQWKPK